MRLEDARRFVCENVSEVSSGEFSVEDSSCIDDRTKEGKRFAIPGDRVGFIGVVAGALKLYEKTHGLIGIEFGRVAKAIGSVLGGMTCHTDADAISNGNISIIAGCAHCSGILEMADEYGVGDYARPIRAYINDLEDCVSPKVLDGEHRPEAVFLIAKADNSQPAITLPGTGKNGQALVCHLEDWLEAATSLAPAIMRCAANSVNEVTLRECIKIVAKRQLGVTLRHLAEGLPVYRVSRDESGAISVELMSEDAATAIA